MSKLYRIATVDSCDCERQKSNSSKNLHVILVHHEYFVVGGKESSSAEDRLQRGAIVIGFLHLDVAIMGLTNSYILLDRRLWQMYLTNTVGFDTIVTLLKKFAAESNCPDIMPAPLLRRFATESKGLSQLKAKAI